MKGIADVHLAGNLTRDPELRTIRTGNSVCELGIAVNEAFKDASGEWQERPSFFDVRVWGKQAESCAQYLSKGRPVLIVGRLRQERWEAQDGSARSKVVVVAQNVVFLGSGDSNGDSGRYQGGNRSGSAPYGGGRSQQAQAPLDDFKDVEFGDESDIPF
jgi:single-strand DNA-binding protein